MIAALYMVVVLATGGLYWLLGTRNIGEIFSIYDVWFFGAMVITSLAVALRPEPAYLRALGVLWLIYATYWANDFADLPESTVAIANTAVSAWFILTMRERWEWLCALCFALMPFAAWSAEIGLWPGYDECGSGFLPGCGPVAVFVLGLIAVMSLGLASDDGGGIRARDGRSIRSWLARPSPILGLAFRRWH
jgi:hypothetical protein